MSIDDQLSDFSFLTDHIKNMRDRADYIYSSDCYSAEMLRVSADMIDALLLRYRMSVKAELTGSSTEDSDSSTGSTKSSTGSTESSTKSSTDISEPSAEGIN